VKSAGIDSGGGNNMKRIPKFQTLEEAAEFWDTHDFEDYVGDTEPVTITVKIPTRQMRLTVPLDLKVYQQIETLATQRGVRIEKMVSAWLKEKTLAESERK
jgi:hypothetical protein